MEDRDDLNSEGFRTIEHAVRRALDDRFSDIGEDDRMDLWVRRDSVEYVLNSRCENDTRTWFLVFVKIKSLIEFDPSFVAEDDRQLQRFAALANASTLISSHAVMASGRALLSASRRSSSWR